MGDTNLQTALIDTLRDAVDREEAALDTAISAHDPDSMKATFKSLTRLRAQLSEAERDASDAS